jgi:hypothetical protein
MVNDDRGCLRPLIPPPARVSVETLNGPASFPVLGPIYEDERGGAVMAISLSPRSDRLAAVGVPRCHR